MKSIIRLSLIVLAIASFTSCSKVILIKDEPITGSWYLSDAAHKDAYGWYGVTTGIENGVFTFYNNGTARYREGNYTMEGTWSVTYISGGYYDEYGNYYTDRHQSLEVHVSDYYGGESIDMYFDHVKFNGGSFVATNYNDHYIEKYIFSRY